MTENAELFTIKLWEEVLNENQQTEWRGKIHHIESGEVCYFRDWSKMMAFLDNRLPHPTTKMERIGSVVQPAGRIHKRRWQRKRMYPHRSSRYDASKREETIEPDRTKTLKVNDPSHPRVRGGILRDLGWFDLEILMNDKLLKKLGLIFISGALAIVGWNLIRVVSPNATSMITSTESLLAGATVAAHKLRPAFSFKASSLRNAWRPAL